MKYRVQFSPASPQWLIGDKPDLSGIVTISDVDGPSNQDLLFGTVCLTWPGNLGDLVRESMVTFDTDGRFVYKFTMAIDKERNGVMLAAVFPDSGASALLNGAIIAGATTADIDNVTGSIPASGWATIESEVVAYTLSGSTLTIERGVFATTDANHADDMLIRFAQNKETCIPQTSTYAVRNKKYL